MTEGSSKSRTAATRQPKPYPEYRHSGVEWLGMLPSHWAVRSLKRLALTVTRGDAPDYVGDSNVRVINQTCIQSDGIHLENVKYQADVNVNSWKSRLLPGDLLVNSTGTGTLDRAVVFRESGRYIADSHVTIVRMIADLVCPEYTAYLINTPVYRRYIYSAIISGSTNQIELSREGLRSTPLIAPPLNEQVEIVNFLDSETERIDALLSKKQRLIDLLEEKRTALVTNAVTKGLNPNVALRDSGVEWLGSIPAHWEVKRLWHLTPPERKIMYGIVLPGPNVLDGVPIVKGGDVSAVRLRPELLSRTASEIEEKFARSRLQGGDLVIAIRGSIGDIAVVPGELAGANLTQDAARIAISKGVLGPWLLYAMRSAVLSARLKAGALGATIKGINIRDLKRVQVPVPPRNEQEAIADFLNAEVQRMDEVIQLVVRAVESLKGLRAALVSAAVTGQIDVREKVP